MLGSALAALALGLTTACGTSGPGADSDKAGVEVWMVEDASVNEVVQSAIDTYSKNAGNRRRARHLRQRRLQAAHPGGARLARVSRRLLQLGWWKPGAQYVKANQVVDLTEAMEANPEFRDAFLPSVLDVAKIDGSYYGVADAGRASRWCSSTTRRSSSEVGVSRPPTYASCSTLVDTFKKEGITPIVLPGTQAWTELMWLEYLTDRIGGAEVSSRRSPKARKAPGRTRPSSRPSKCARTWSSAAPSVTNFASLTSDNARRLHRVRQRQGVRCS